MTQINAIADGELNKLIHEKMLGFTRDFLQSEMPNIKVWIGETPDYCNSLDNAFMVVEALRENGILCSMINSIEGIWTVSILEWNAVENSWQVEATISEESLSRAICQAVAVLIES
jgi:hypothetical protein